MTSINVNVTYHNVSMINSINRMKNWMGELEEEGGKRKRIKKEREKL